MNEQGTDGTSPMPAQEAALPAYKDRRTALLVFGVAEVVLGAVAWLLSVLMGFMTIQMARQGMSPASMLPSLLAYVAGGAVFVTLGIGSIRCRRWAVALWRAIAGGWTLYGVVGLVMAGFWLPQIAKGIPAGGEGGPPPEVMKAILLGVVVFTAAVMVGLPLILWLFYRSRHVRATCEAEQPEGSWTDGHAPATLGAALWLAMSALMSLGMGFAYGGLHPFFGTYLRGGVGLGMWLLGGAVYAVAVVGLLRRQSWGAALGLVYLVISSAAAITTYLKADVREMYEAMGMPEPQLALMERMGFMSSGYMIGMTAMFVLPLVVMLLASLRGGARSE